MSIQSEINRISGNVADALAAIAEKGVTVPNGSNSDALAGLIAAIQAGGGGAKTAYGSITYNADAIGKHNVTQGDSYITIEHGMGVTPKVFCVLNANEAKVDGKCRCYVYLMSDAGTSLIGYARYTGSNYYYTNHGGKSCVVGDNNIKITSPTTAYTITFHAGDTVYWAAAGE